MKKEDILKSIEVYNYLENLGILKLLLLHEYEKAKITEKLKDIEESFVQLFSGAPFDNYFEEYSVNNYIDHLKLVDIQYKESYYLLTYRNTETKYGEDTKIVVFDDDLNYSSKDDLLNRMLNISEEDERIFRDYFD